MNKWDKIYKLEKYKFSSQQSWDSVISHFKKNGIGLVLDLGCGDGKHSFYLAKKRFDVVGFDVSHEAIKLAKKRLVKENNLPIKFLQGSMYKKFPFKDGSFDAVVSLRTLNHGTKIQIQHAISEIYRVLKNNGCLFITVIKINGVKNILGKTYFNNLPVEIIDPHTYVPQEGKEKGIIHFMFNKKILLTFFKKFKIIKFWVAYGKQHWERYYCLLGQKKHKFISVV